MKVKDFYFDLPEELIAQHPLEQRDASRLMVVNQATGEIEHKSFGDIIEYGIAFQYSLFIQFKL